MDWPCFNYLGPYLVCTQFESRPEYESHILSYWYAY